MSLLSRKRTILAKIESTYGTDPTPTGGANAILLRSLNVAPIQADIVSRDLIRTYLGNSEQLLASAYVSLDFEVEIQGSGTAGVAPAWAPLLKACAFAETVSTLAISSLTRASSTATATATAHGKVTGDVVKISGATETEYNGNFTINVTNASTFTYTVTGTPATPATGSPILNSSVSYAPISSSFPSVTIYFGIDGVRHKITGARGSVEFTISARQIPVMKFNFTGLYNTPTDTADPTPDYSGFIIPKVSNSTNTPVFSIFGFAGVLQNLSLNMGNQVNYRALIGSESVLMLDRKPSGTLLFEAALMASYNFFSAAQAGTTGALALTQGTVGGKIFTFAAPVISLANPNYQDDNGVHMLSVPFVAVPSSGNDEFVLTVK